MRDSNIYSTKESKSLSTEITAGLTTFLAMAYIAVVNPSILAETGMDPSALVVATCLIAGISSILMGIIARVPIAMAPGMGLNAFFTYTVVISEGIPWQTALGMVFWAGVLFLVLSLLGLREKLVTSIPPSLISAISAGIGLFILFIGIQNMGLVADHPSTLVGLGNFGPQTLVALAGLLTAVILYMYNHSAAILWGMGVSALLAITTGMVETPSTFFTSDVSLKPVLLKLNIKDALQWHLLPTIFVFFYVDMFDTVGTLVACAREADLEESDGRIHGLRKMLGVDAVATVASSLLGSSPTTSYIESGAGILAGGRTGITSITTGLLFLCCIPLTPVLAWAPTYVTACALVLVGLIMTRQVRKIEFDKLEEAIPAVLTFTLMPLTYSISTGLAFGFISWVLLKICSGKFRKISPVMYLIFALSVISLILH